ncbi:MAG: hypothetical protein V4819_19250 [Verrucomicrobiota bacterium]
MNDNETQIVWRLTKAEKGRYVAAARAHAPPLPLVGWLKLVADAASEPLSDDRGEGSGRDMARERSRVDAGGGLAPGDDSGR